MANISLGFQTRAGFDGADLVSPAQAAATGGLVDQRWDDDPQLPVEVRVHGVSGSTGPEILTHPHALRVGGQNPTAFYRRWSPDGGGRASVPWPLEAYSWGGLTERPLASASWVLLAPFMFYNVAYFMLPTGPVAGHDRSPLQRLGRALVRLLALAATLQFVGGLLVLFVSTLGWQNAARKAGSAWWTDWLTHAGTSTRLGYGLIAVWLIVMALWRASIRTADHYESFTDVPPSGTSHGRVDTPAAHSGAGLSTLRLRRRGFWQGAAAAARQRNAHVAAAFSFCTLLVSSASAHAGGRQNAERILATAILLAAIVLTAVATDRDTITGDGDGNTARFGSGFRLLAWSSWALTGVTAVTAHWVVRASPAPPDPSPSASLLVPPHLLGAATALMLIQFGLILVLWLVVIRLRSTSPCDEADGWKPFLNGWSAPFICLLAMLLGGALSAALNIGVARIFAQPSGIGLLQGRGPELRTPHLLYLPDQTFAYANGAVVAVIAVLVITGALYRRYLLLRRSFAGPAAGASPEPPVDPGRTAAPGQLAGRHPDRVRDWYPATESTGPHPADQHDIDRVAGSWAVAALTDRIAVVVAVLAVSWGTGVVAVVVLARDNWGPLAAWTAPVVTLGVLIGALLAAFGVWLLRSEYRSLNGRKTIGALWDIGTFWPRATHPLAPPCYAEQAVPEVVERIRLLTGEPLPWSIPDADPELDPDRAGDPEDGGTPLAAPRQALLTGYSQGTIISAAVIAQLPEPTLAQVSLLTLACPLRRLYGRAFPAYFGPAETDALAQLLRTRPPGQPQSEHPRWRNLVRHTDYIGGWVFAPPVPRTSPGSSDAVDGVSLDPPSLIPGPGRALAPTHYHSAWWQDPLTITYAALLTAPRPAADAVRSAAEPLPIPIPIPAPDPAGPEPE